MTDVAIPKVETDDLIDLGSVVEETRGPPLPNLIETFGALTPCGLSDD